MRHIYSARMAIYCIIIAVGLFAAPGQAAPGEEPDRAGGTVAVTRGLLEGCGRDDPFAPLVSETAPKPPVPDRVESPSETQDQRAVLPPLSLGGIVWSPTLPQAIINETVVGIGGKVAGRTVVSIDQDKVVLELDGKKQTLRVEAITLSPTTTRALPKE